LQHATARRIRQRFEHLVHNLYLANNRNIIKQEHGAVLRWAATSTQPSTVATCAMREFGRQYAVT
jgi:hypothetical protein